MGLELAAEKGAHLAMRSPINWALLGLVIQRPSYGYELVQRFERTYGEAIELSSPSQIYTALDSLARRELIETMHPDGEHDFGGGRQPKPHYRATATGAREYEQWLVCQLQQERQRSRMFAQQLAALAPSAGMSVLERCERGLLAQARAPAPAAEDADGADRRLGLSARLVAEEDRLGIGARLEWIEYARQELRALTRRRPDA